MFQNNKPNQYTKGNLTVSDKISSLYSKQVELNQSIDRITKNHATQMSSFDKALKQMEVNNIGTDQIIRNFKLLKSSLYLFASGLLITLVFVAIVIRHMMGGM